jgi:diguanylate cyclase (GGDEF)-like protein
VDQNKCSLLVVDDERYVLATLAATLQNEFDVVTAASAEEAIRLFGQREINLILCDQRMPGMTGVELLQWVRQNHPKTIRLLMTGYAELEDAVEAINRGQVYRYIFKPWRLDELLQVLGDAAKTFILQRDHERLLADHRRLIEELENRVQQRTRELEEANRQLHQRNVMLEKLALTDELTGLPNRRAIEQILQSEHRRRARYPDPLAIGLIDADHFKDINTRYLLPGGDEVLRGLARTLNSSLRATDTVGRWGGEEFLVVAPVTTPDGALSLGERIRQAVEQMRVYHNDEEIRVTVSLGFAVVEEDYTVPPDLLIRQASAALREAKMRGRNCCVVWLATCAAQEKTA